MTYLFRILASIFLLVMMAYAGLFLLLPPVAPTLFASDQVDVIAHQGGNLENPDATFAAYDHAVSVHASVLEMDVHLSLDGQLVVLHDAKVDRTTNGQGDVRSMTLSEIQQLDAGYWWPYHSNDDLEKQNVPKDANFPFRGQGLNIVALEAMFERYPSHRFVIELKDNTPELRSALLNMIAKYDRWNRVLIASFYQDTLETIREQEPRAQTYGAEAEIRLFYVLHRLRLERLFPYDIDAFAIPMSSGGFDLTTPHFVASAKRAGILLHYWTINEADDMEKLLRLGVDGIMTDRPALLKEVQQAF
jgi:glycerophosphoryl diester phosphodiesterase